METSEKKDNTNKRLLWGHILGMKKNMEMIDDVDEKTKDLHRDKWRHL